MILSFGPSGLVCVGGGGELGARELPVEERIEEGEVKKVLSEDLKVEAIKQSDLKRKSCVCWRKTFPCSKCIDRCQ